VLLLCVRHHAFDGFDIGCIDHVGAAQSALTLLIFLGQDMAVEGVTTLESAGSGFLETFGRAPIGFHLGHGNTPFCFHFQKAVYVTSLKRSPQRWMAMTLAGSVALLITLLQQKQEVSCAKGREV